MSNCYHEEKGVTVNELHNHKPDTNCTCDVGATGPAADPELLVKRREPLEHPETPTPTGPAADPELIAKRREPIAHPETPEATGPAR